MSQIKNPFKLTFKLKQHTPLIHFQHVQKGATLRESEMRPKLDKFIIQKLTGESNYEVAKEMFKKTHPGWLVGGGQAGHVALDYQMGIEATRTKEYLLSSSISRYVREELDRKRIGYLSGVPYFADNEKIKKSNFDEAKKGIMMDNIVVDIFCLNTDLLQEIKFSFPYLLTYQNFGTRQSKGFGSFSLEETTTKDFENMLLENPAYKKTMCYTFRNKPRLLEIFKKIDGEYKVLKSGFAKEPSQLMIFFKDMKVEWEKSVVKKELVQGRGIPSKEDYSDDRRYKYIRALLGLAELYEFPKARRKIKIECIDNVNGEKKVERFKSPLTFKVFENKIYILVDNIPDEMYDTRFSFTLKSNDERIILKTPSKDTPLHLKTFLEKHIENSWKYV